MTGDISRRTERHARANGYTRGHDQQGRVQLDADRNEQVDIERELTRVAVRDAVGLCGVPRENAGFQIGRSGGELEIGPGRMYADGVLIENAAPVLVADQPFGDSLIATPDSDADSGGGSLVYVEVREQEVSALDDPRLREKALGGPDTMTRTQTQWKVGVIALEELGVIADDVLAAVADRSTLDIDAWAPTTGRLRAAASVAAVDADGRPCLLPPTAGFSGQENLLYRVEIHSGGDLGTARYKWSRRNGSIQGMLREADGVRTLVGVEANERIGTGNWVEVQTAEQRRGGEAGPLVQVTINPDRSVALDPDLGEVDGTIVTLWDHPPDADAAGFALHSAPALLESGVEVSFTDGTYEPGESWTIPARAATADIEWPPVAGGPDEVRPDGRGSARCPLALISADGGLTDLRIEFPPLTAIRADDVSYDNSVVDIDGAINVQEALERLAQRESGACTLHAEPGVGWHEIFDEVGPGQDAHICLEVGQYPLESVVSIVGKGHIELTGCGRGTHIVAPNLESALRFNRCAGVSVRNLRITAGTGGDVVSASGRNGALDCRDCGPVHVDSITARCGNGTPRASAAINVSLVDRAASQQRGRGDVSVTNSTIIVGLQQIGVNLVNTRRARVADNTIFAAENRSSFVWDRLSQTPSLRAEIAEVLVAQAPRGGGGTPTTGPPILTSGEPVDAARPDGLLTPGRVRIDPSETVELSAEELGLIARAAADDAAGADLAAAADLAARADVAAAADLSASVPAAAASAAPAPVFTVGLDVTNRWEARTLTLDGNSIDVLAYPPVADRLAVYLEVAGPAGIQTDDDLGQHVQNVLSEALLNGGTVRARRRRTTGSQPVNFDFDLLSEWIGVVAPAVPSHMSQGVVVGGEAAEFVEIHNNEITMAIQPIHVGLSSAGQSPSERDIAGRVSVIGNMVDLPSVPLSRSRHGIFCGNVESVRISDNSVRRVVFAPSVLQALPVIGVNVHGRCGPFAAISNNDVRGCATGVRFFPEPISRSEPQWLIDDNLLLAASRIIDARADSTSGKLTLRNNVS